MKIRHLLGLAMAGASAFTGCGDDDPAPCQGGGCEGGGANPASTASSTGSAGGGGDGGGGGSQQTASKVDLLFVIDNSRGMGDHQAALSAGVRHLLDGITNPPCVDGGGVVSQPAAPTEPCPGGSVRRHAPIRDLHIGFISSSLGSLTANACAGPDPTSDDKAHLLSRTELGSAPTYAGKGFLAFDPDGVMSPPGDPDIESISQTVADIIRGIGQTGCGYEMPLEAMTRFLVDPDPHDALSQNGGLLQQNGTDQIILEQRADFLRPDSALGIVLFSNENDCSVNVFGQGHLVLDLGPFYRSTSICQTDPESACCTSCALPVPSGCTTDPTCGAQGTASAAKYTAVEDQPSLSCWDQKRRYGVDFLFPAARFVNALSQPMIDPNVADLAGNAVQNPLFAGGRSPSAVHLLVLAGAPWQDVASDPFITSSPLLTSAELETLGQWDWLGGGEPFTDESVLARSGTNPATAAGVADANPINGGDRTIAGTDDLQYTCITPLESPEPNGCQNCGSECDDPTCNGSDRIASRAYPGIRHFEVARGLGASATAASVCPPDPSAPFETALDAFAIAIGTSLAD